MNLEALPQPAQDRDRVLDRRLVDQHRLEAALERRVLLDVPAVLVERGGADAVQLAAREHRLEHVAGVHRPLGGAGADDRVQLVDEQQDPPLAGLDLLQHRLQPLLELAAVLGPRHQRAHVEGEDRLVLQPFRNVAADDPLRQPLDDRGLADPGVADQHGVVLGLARQDLHHPADLRVAADHRVELSAPRLGHQVAAVLLQCLVGGLRRGAGHALGTTDLGQDLEDSVAVAAVLAEQVGGVGVGAGPEHREDEMLDRDVLVLEPLRFLLGGVQQLPERASDPELAARGAGSAYPRSAFERSLDRGPQGAGVDVGSRQQAWHEAVGLLEQREQQVRGVHLGVSVAQRLGLRVVQCLLALQGQAVGVHVITSYGVVGGARPASRRSSSSIRASSSQASTAPA